MGRLHSISRNCRSGPSHWHTHGQRQNSLSGSGSDRQGDISFSPLARQMASREFLPLLPSLLVLLLTMMPTVVSSEVLKLLSTEVLVGGEHVDSAQAGDIERLRKSQQQQPLQRPSVAVETMTLNFSAAGAEDVISPLPLDLRRQRRLREGGKVGLKNVAEQNGGGEGQWGEGKDVEERTIQPPPAASGGFQDILSTEILEGRNVGNDESAGAGHDQNRAYEGDKVEDVEGASKPEMG